MQLADFELIEVLDCFDQLACNQMEPAASRAKFDGRLGPVGHACTSTQKKVLVFVGLITFNMGELYSLPYRRLVIPMIGLGYP